MWKGFLLLIYLLLSSQLHAEVYRWTDENGRTHFSDRPPSGNTEPSAGVDTIEEESLAPQNTFAPQHENYEGNGTDYRQREKEVKAERKQKRIERERKQAAAVVKKQKCKEARENYRLYNIGKSRAESLESLMKQRQRRDRLKEKIKTYCY